MAIKRTERLQGIALDLAGIAGIAAITYGAWLIYVPAGYIVGGAFALAVPVLKSLADR